MLPTDDGSSALSAAAALAFNVDTCQGPVPPGFSDCSGCTKKFWERSAAPGDAEGMLPEVGELTQGVRSKKLLICNRQKARHYVDDQKGPYVAVHQIMQPIVSRLQWCQAVWLQCKLLALVAQTHTCLRSRVNKLT
jgi:hypothetical protein